VVDASQITIHDTENPDCVCLPVFSKLGVCEDVQQKKHADLSCSLMVQRDN